VYRLLYRPDLYLMAYGKISRNHGATTRGATDETVDAMSLDKIATVIDAVRHERYRWSPARRTYIPKKDGMPPGVDKCTSLAPTFLIAMGACSIAYK
jgi:hypothetical protein